MPYIGNIPAEKYAAFNVQYFTTSATATYTLDRAVANELDIRLVINNVIQEPGAGKAYTAAGTTLTLSAATAGSDTMYCVYIGKAVQTVNPGANSVGPTALQDNSVTNAKLADATQGDIIYYAGAGAPAQLSAGTSGFFLKTQGAGANPIWAADNDTVSVVRPNAQPLIINGNIGMWQRSASTVTMSDGYYNVDRFRGEEGTDGTATWSRSTSVPDNTGLPFSLQVDCTGTDSSIGSGQQINVQQTIEAQNLQLLKWGTSDAEKVTLAFWVKSNQTGQHSVSFRKLDNTAYNQPKIYTINSADTWEKKVLVFSALTLSGGGIENDNGDGLQLFWKLAAGSSYQGTADTWTATNQGATAVSGDVNFMSSTSNNWYVTGVQLEVGEYTSATLPPFQHETFANNLQRCQRYYFDTNPSRNGIAALVGAGYNNTTNLQGTIQFPVSMRTAPSLFTVGGTGYWAGESTPFDTFDNLDIYNSSDNRSGIQGNGNVSGTVGVFANIRFRNAAARCAFNAEL